MSGDERRFLVDASVFITLAEIGQAELLDGLNGQVEMPFAVVEEVTDDPAASVLSEARGDWLNTQGLRGASSAVREIDSSRAASHLGKAHSDDGWDGDIALLTYALWLKDCNGNVVLVTDDKPLRKTCKFLSIPVSGSIGVLVRAVERGHIAPDGAKKSLYAIDEVGARLSASLVRRAERLIDEAAAEPDG